MTAACSIAHFHSNANTVMPDCYWTIPVARWASLPATGTPDLREVEPLMRRRLSTLSKMALKVAYDCTAGYGEVRVVFASRHGELRRTSDILGDIAASQPVSPTAFSLSVLNAASGIFGIGRGDRSAATAISSGAETLGYALLEAHAQYETDPSTPVLVVYADEPAAGIYGHIDDEIEGGALAILIDAAAPARFACTLEEGTLSPSAPRFSTQSAAVLHSITQCAEGAWHSESTGRTWRWAWQGAAA
jgi:hypothetical protein